MSRTSFDLLWLLLAVSLIAAPPLLAQQTGKVPRVCFLSSRAGIEAREDTFRQGLRELGYIEGKNIEVEWRFGKENADRLPAFAAELNHAKCDVIIAGGTEAAKALKNATGAVPIVFTVASDPVG